MEQPEIKRSASSILEQIESEIDKRHSAIRNHANSTHDLAAQLQYLQEAAKALRVIIANGDRELTREELEATFFPNI